MTAEGMEERRVDKVGRLQRDMFEVKKDILEIKRELVVGDDRMKGLQHSQDQQNNKLAVLTERQAANTTRIEDIVEGIKDLKTNTDGMVKTFNHLVGFRTVCMWAAGTIVTAVSVLVGYDTLITRLRGPQVPAVVAPVPANPVVNQPPK